MNKSDFNNKKTGAALILVLGFLTVLLILAVAFVALMRTGRLADHAFLMTAQTRQLLHTALTRAMEDIDLATVTGDYPEFLALGSANVDEYDSSLINSIRFLTEARYLPLGNTAVSNAYASAVAQAEWQTVHYKGQPFGRVGYVIINTSGLLDANYAGGQSNGIYRVRSAGHSPAEIQLSKTLLPELNRNAAYFPRIASSGMQRDAQTAENPDLSPALALVYNRDNAWRNFETLRDVTQLNRLGKPNILPGKVASFCTFSYRPAGDQRTFMGCTPETLNIDHITAELRKIGIIENPDFVINQLRDYVDTDFLPEDKNGNYTDYSVEPTPLINELTLNCTFSLTPERSKDSGDKISSTVVVSNAFSLDIELWYPFTGITNPAAFTIQVPEPLAETGELPESLFGRVSDWTNTLSLPPETAQPGNPPHSYPLHRGGYGIEVKNEETLFELFESLQSRIRFPSIYCTADGTNPVDRVLDLELFLQRETATVLLPELRALSGWLFDADHIGRTTNVSFSTGRAVIDPRLNWSGTNLNQWVQTGEQGYLKSSDRINSRVISDNVSTPDQTQQLYIRNQGKIDSPYEFTYLLYSPEKPWKTFQFIAENDPDGTRMILNHLSPFPNEPPRHGLINPYSPHTNVIATVFMNLPTREYNKPDLRRMDAVTAREAARIFMKYVAEQGWPSHAAEYGQGINADTLQQVVRGPDNPWAAESFLRNTYELFNPRDTLYTILTTAQKGTDRNKNGRIDDDEIQATQQAVVYIWRDPETGKSACVFYGLSDTLQSALDGQTWGERLKAFKP